MINNLYFSVMSIKEQKPNEYNAPLLRRNSTPEITIRRNTGKTLLNKRKVTVAPLKNCNNGTVFVNKTFIDQESHTNDISAMSVISLYQSGENLDSEMDTDRYLYALIDIFTPLCTIKI